MEENFLKEVFPHTPFQELLKRRNKGQRDNTRKCFFTPMGPLPHS